MHAEPTKYVHAQNATKLYFELTDVLRNCASRRCNCSSCSFHCMFVINNCTFIPFETHQHPIYISPLLDGQKILFILCIVRFLIKSTDKLVHSSWQWLYFPCIYGIWISNTVKKCWRHHMLCTCFDMVQSTKRILWFYKIFSNVQG